MSVERLAVRAGTAMRTAIEGEVDVMTALREIENRAGAQQRNTRVGAIAAAAAVVALLIGGVAWLLLGNDDATTAPRRRSRDRARPPRPHLRRQACPVRRWTCRSP